MCADDTAISPSLKCIFTLQEDLSRNPVKLQNWLNRPIPKCCKNILFDHRIHILYSKNRNIMNTLLSYTLYIIY